MSDEATDLRSVLARAAEEHEADRQSEPEVSESEPAAEPQETPEAPEAKSGERPRGADGKFLPAEKGGAAAETPADEGKASPVSEGAAKPEGDPAPSQPAIAPVEAPKHWSQADKEWLASIPDSHRQSVLDRFKAWESALTPRLQRAAHLERDYGPVVELFAPHVEGLRARGQTPAHVIQAWANVEGGLINHRLAVERGQRPDGTGPQILARIIRDYKIDPGEVAAILMGETPVQAAMPAAAALPPEFIARLDRLETAERVRIEGAQRQRVQSWEQRIADFAAEKDDGGNPKHPYFAELEADMTALAQLDIAAGKNPELSDLYDRAVYANRTTRAKLLAAQQAAQAGKEAAERKARTEAAQRAAVSVTGSPGASQAAERSRAANRSLRDTIRDAAGDLDAA